MGFFYFKNLWSFHLCDNWYSSELFHFSFISFLFSVIRHSPWEFLTQVIWIGRSTFVAFCLHVRCLYVSRVCVALMLAELVHRTEWFVVSYFFLVLNHQTGMSCGNPPSISNGNLVYNSTSYNSTAHYSCNEGYNLNTAPVKRCTAKKRWEGLTPRCCEYTFAVRSSCRLNCWSILWGGGGGLPYLGFTATCCHIILRVMIHRYRVCNLASIKSFFLSLRTKLFWTLAICALFNSQFRPLRLYMHVLEPSWSRFWEKIILSWRMLTRPIGVG